MKRLIVFLLGVVIGWQLVGKMDRHDWDALIPSEKIAVINLFSDRYFQDGRCGGANFKALADDKEVLFFFECVKPRIEAKGGKNEKENSFG